MRRSDETHRTYGILLLLLGLGHFVSARWRFRLHLALVVSLGLGDLARDSFATTPAGFPLGPLLPLLLILEIGGLGDLNDNLATVELLLVESFDGLLSSLYGGDSNETVACRPSAAKDDLG